MAIRGLSTPCVKLASFLIFSPASGETRVRAQAVENASFNSLLEDVARDAFQLPSAHVTLVPLMAPGTSLLEGNNLS
jgi:hypothetical protein